MLHTKKTRFTTVSITHDFARNIDPWIKAGDYQSKADFIREAIREKIERLRGEASQ